VFINSCVVEVWTRLNGSESCAVSDFCEHEKGNLGFTKGRVLLNEYILFAFQERILYLGFT